MVMEELISQQDKKRAWLKANEAEESLMERGYIFTELFGWELPENITRWGFTIEEALTLKGIPCKEDLVEETGSRSVPETDSHGNKTGRYIQETYSTGTKMGIVIDQRWILYCIWKKQRLMKQLAEKYNGVDIDEPMQGKLI